MTKFKANNPGTTLNCPWLKRDNMDLFQVPLKEKIVDSDNPGSESLKEEAIKRHKTLYDSLAVVKVC